MTGQSSQENKYKLVFVFMSCSNSQLSERRLSANGKNAYIVLSSTNNNNNNNIKNCIYDPQKNKNYLTAKPINERSLSPTTITCAPICVEHSTKENQKNKQTTDLMVDKKSNIQDSNNINSTNNNI